MSLVFLSFQFGFLCQVGPPEARKTDTKFGDSPRIPANSPSSSGLDFFTSILVIASMYNIVPCLYQLVRMPFQRLWTSFQKFHPPTCRVCCFRLETAPRLRNPVKRFTRKVSPDATSAFFEFKASAETSRIFRLRGVRITAPL